VNRVAFVVSLIIVPLLATGASVAQTGTWNVDADGDWNTAGNWSGGIPNGAGDTAIFGNVITADRAVRINVNVTLGTMAFDDNNNYTVNRQGSRTLLFNNGGAGAAITVTNNNGDGAHTITSPVRLADNLNISQGSAGTFTISGQIYEASGTRNITKSGSGTLALTAANSTYTGVTTINGGVLRASTLANGGSASSIGNSSSAAGNLVLNGGTLQYTGAAVSSNRLFTLGTTAGSAIDASGSGALNLTNAGSIVLSGANTARTFTLTGSNTGNNTLAAVLGDNGTGATSLAKSGAGTWVLSGTNTYTGTTTISEGTLKLGSATALYNSGTVNVTGGTFDIAGYSETIGQIDTMTNGSIINSGAAGAQLRLNNADNTLTATGTNTISANVRLNGFAGARTRTFDLTGAGDSLTISGVLSQGSAGAAVTKSGDGTLYLTGANSYTGVTTINGGVLSASTLADGGVNSSIGASTNAAANLVLNGGTLQYTGAGASSDRLFTLGTTAAGSAIDASGSGALNLTNTGSIVLSGTDTARNFTLTGTNTGANTLAAVLGDNGTGATSLTKSGAGTHQRHGHRNLVARESRRNHRQPDRGPRRLQRHEDDRQ